MNRFAQGFERCRREGRAALMPYMTAGDPSLEWTERLIDAAVEAGADMIELGVPYSDPLADGPTVQAAGQRALAAGVTVDGIFGLVRRVRARYPALPLALLVYYNCVFRRGERRFVEDAAAAGVDGLIIPDLPPEEGGGVQDAAAEAGIDVIYLVAPTSTPERIRLIASRSTAFIYCVSLTGVTGARSQLSASLDAFLSRVRREVRAAGKELPLAVGFGISKPEHVAEVSRLADGVIVGSALIDTFHGQENLEAGLEACRSMIQAMRSAALLPA
ncbi:MAG: tryptophan synthase subunit alpha [Firmicutes bacterium]|nr:tryptophan synthase subunit alpha [Bacillota bacterium]MBO2520411.1 tryptophan synthase subunit alpha [Bacillota bacterium]